MQRAGACFVCLLLWSSALVAQAPADSGKLASEVKAWVDQLEKATSEEKKLAAEWALLKLGPEIVPLLPKADKLSESLKQRLLPIEAALLELRPRTVKVSKTEMPLSAALKLLHKETGLTVVDRRQGDHDHPVTLDFDGASFWQVVEALAAQTKAGLSFYQADNQVALVDAPYRQVPLSLHGPFRVAVKRITTARDQDAGTHVCIVGLEIGWEPRFLPFLVDAGAVALRAGKDVKGQPFVAQLPSRGAVRVTGGLAHEFDLLFAAPPRKKEKIDELKGYFTVTTPAKMLTFSFKDFQALTTPRPSDTQTQDGVRVTINKIIAQKDRWIVEVAIENPKAGPQLESHQTSWWSGNNTLHLEKGKGENLVVLQPEPLLEQRFNVTPTRATIRYHFLTKNANGVPLSVWRLVCRTPGRIVETTVPYAFKDLQLP